MLNKTTTILALFCCLSAGNSFAQTLQYSEQKGVWNEFTDLIWLNDSLYVASENIRVADVLQAASLTAFDLNGDIIWTQESPDSSEIMAYHSLVDISDSSFAVLGYYQYCCDCTQPEPFVELRNNVDGTLINRVGQVISSESANSPFGKNAGNVAKTSSGFAILRAGWPTAIVYVFSAQGDSIHSFGVDDNYNQMIGFQGDLLLSSDNKMKRVTVGGMAVDSVTTTGAPLQIVANDERLARVYQNEIRLYDENLDYIDNQTFGGTGLFVDAISEGFAVYNGESIMRMLNNGNMVEQAAYPNIEGFRIGKLTANGENIVISGAKVSAPFSLYNITQRYSALRATNFDGNAQAWISDLEITDVQIGNYEITSISSPVVNYSLQALVTVKNNGLFPVQTYHLNHVITASFCGPVIRNIPVNQEILVGESAVITYEGIQGFTLTSSADSASINACVFVTHPNSDIDVDLENDSHCASFSIPLSTSLRNLSTLIKVYPNPAQNKIRLETDLNVQSFTIHNTVGQPIKRGSLIGVQIIDTSDLPNGLYILSVQTDRGIASKRLIVAR